MLDEILAAVLIILVGFISKKLFE